MRLILTDIPKSFLDVKKESVIIEDNGKMRNCIGCFGCWIKSPGECIIKDGYEHLGKQFGACDELVIISKCTYGSVSPFIKNVLDRSIGCVLPYFEIIDSEMHHKKRYDNVYSITMYFYGENITATEKETAHKFLKAVAVDFHGSVNSITFLNNIAELGDKL